MWDIKSVILYLVMASIGYFCISEERRSIQNGVRRRLKVSYAILFFVWLFLAVYRYVGYESGIIIGGNDAPTYIDYFQTCLAGKGNNIYFVRTEPLFQIMTKAVRTITSNYHVYFALIYGLIIFSYLRFIDEFDLLQSNKTPLFMLVLSNHKKEKKAHVMLALAALVPSVLAGIRDYTIGTDIATYGHWLFIAAQNAKNPITFALSKTSIDFLYSVFVYCTAHIFQAEHWLYFFTGALIYGFTIAGLYRYRKKCG